jgi:hypothetical protein
VPVPAPAGYTRSVGFSLNPKVIGWLPAVLLTIVFFCTFFSWVASYLGDSKVHWQSPWRAMFGSVGRDPRLVEFKAGKGEWRGAVTSDAELVVPFFLCLFVALAFAWADRGLHSLDPRKLPPLAKLWPWRRTVIAVTAGLAFVLAVTLVSNGFGMERAIRDSVRTNPELVKLREDAGGSLAKGDQADDLEANLLRAYDVHRTWWQDVALTCLFLAVLSVLLAIALEKRGDKPPPRLVLHY